MASCLQKAESIEPPVDTCVRSGAFLLQGG